MKQFLVCFAIAVSLTINAQSVSKKVINNDAYDLWNSISTIEWSADGQYFTYVIGAPKNDNWLYFQNAKTLEKDSIFKGKDAAIHFQSEFAVFLIDPGYDTIRTLKLKDTKPDKLPKDSLGITWLKTDSLLLVPNIKSFALAEKGDWIAYLSTNDDRPDCPKYKKWQWLKKRKKCDRPKTTGHSLTVHNPLSNNKITIDRVVDYRFNQKGTILYYSTSLKGEVDTINLYALDLVTNQSVEIIKNQLDISSLTIDEGGQQIAFTTTADTNKIKTYQLAYWTTGDTNVRILVDTNTVGLKDGWAVSEFSKTYFAKDGESIFFGTNEMVEQEPEDSLLDTEKAKLDVWSWTDKEIQPQQLRQLRRTKKETFPTRYNLITGKITHLTTSENESIYINTDFVSQQALGRSTDAYLKTNSWDFPWKADYFIVDFETGEKQIILTEQAFFPTLSPSGNYLVWYNGADSNWMATTIKTNNTVNLTENIEANFFSDNNGNPSSPFPEGSLGWTSSDGVERVLVQSEFDIYELNPVDHTNPNPVTKSLGKASNVKYTMYHFDEDSIYINLNRCLFRGVNQKTKAEFIVRGLDFSTPYLGGDHTFLSISKSAASDHILYRTMTVSKYPDLILTSLNFNHSKEITHVNPQQSDYNWATVEQVYWKSYKGLELEGLLYKPENFDSTKQYPMIVYFYEKYDDRLHNYYSPRPTASIVFPTEYASNGYVVFIPNILYTPGHPAQSAYDCIVSGTDFLTTTYSWIDTNKLALQGQSWGGYQTAQLITMTDKYACAMAGAPVSNMFSAYGGIRWGSGMSRMFQYEKTQSRIGCTIWDCPELYMENSPIFGLPKVKTPLLIMHNDNDGAVPWYQGIEMFMGLRRLEKPVWMLNYNGDQHNLMQNANREDLSLRMRQFFDYYLKDEPMPLWMKNGVPAIEKGNPSNLELETEE
ncbi:MAG: prolyl oligopeptidase family serine peptidase [Putridiphycobacter sp.]|nr:prolyl oligopeptidase family serine peptidase [Putridiphycobacter sp.]